MWNNTNNRVEFTVVKLSLNLAVMRNVQKLQVFEDLRIDIDWMSQKRPPRTKMRVFMAHGENLWQRRSLTRDSQDEIGHARWCWYVALRNNCEIKGRLEGQYKGN